MNITLLNGSPKAKNSASGFFLNGLTANLKGASLLRHTTHTLDFEALVQDLQKSDAFVLAFPLYVDGIPAHLLQLLEQLQAALTTWGSPAKVYACVNCGFFEARQTHVALSQLQLWARKCALPWGCGLGIGGGGMAGAAPIGHGPGKNWDLALKTLAADILHLQTAENFYTEPNFPRAMYKAMAHFSWRVQGRKHGLSSRDLYRQRPLL